MEYAKDIILNVGYKRLNGVRKKISLTKFRIKQIKDVTANVYCLIKRGTSFLVSVVKNNKLICLALSLLVILMSADFILINNFMKIFSTLY